METAQSVLLFILLICVAAEVTWSRVRDRGAYNFRESMSNLGMLVVNNLLKPLAVAWAVLVTSLFEPLQVYRLPDTGWAFLLTFVIVDLAYYWYHRLSHEIPLLWAMHYTHHSSPWMNLTTAVRLNWIAKFVSPVYFAPLVVLGVSPVNLGISLSLGLLYQLFLHTETVGRLGRFEGKVLNTPSAHRVHHGCNPRYIDKNYAGVFIVWDRLFGTYEAEREPVRYGVTTGFVGHNPLVVQFLPLWKYIRGEWRREKQVGPERASSERAAA